MAKEDLVDALGQTTINLPLRAASKIPPLKNIEEDLTKVEFTDPIPKAAPPEPKAKGTSAGELYKSDIQASVDALETGRKAQLQLESDKAVNEAERLAANKLRKTQHDKNTRMLCLKNQSRSFRMNRTLMT
jgi:hypothetical protein